jgi:hypothetical protein
MKTIVAILMTTYSAFAFAGSETGYGSGTSIPPTPDDRGVQTRGSTGDYRDVIDKDWEKSRGLVQIPTDNANGMQKSVCHSVHHSPNKTGGETVDTYTTELGGCVYMAVLQEWRKTFCKAGNKSGCQVSLGDVSHKTNRLFNGLKSHANGQCFNVRPMQKGDYRNEVVSWKEDRYDADMTRKFIQLLRDKGVRQVMFNDPTTGAQKAPGLDNVINFCVTDSDEAKKACHDLKYDASICGEPNSY